MNNNLTDPFKEWSLTDRALYEMANAFGFTHRKTEAEKLMPQSFHSVFVGKMLHDNGCDERTVVAGILHDVIEDTPYTYDRIDEKFGKDISAIVREVTEDKNKSWEERKEEAIQRIRTASLSAKYVELADKINNLETLQNAYEQEGNFVFEHFRKGSDKQLWYFTEMLNAILEGVDVKGNTIIKRLAIRYKKALEHAKQTMFRDRKLDVESDGREG